MISLASEKLIILAMLLPLLAAVLIVLVDKKPNLRDALSIIISLALLATVLSLLPSILEGNQTSITLLEIVPGLPITFTLEPLGMLFACVAALLWPVNTLYSIGYMRGNKEKHQTRFYICFAIALSCTMGIALAGNLLTLFICYELLTLSTYPLVTHKGNEDAKKAGRVYLGILLSTSIGFFLLAILWTWHLTGTLDFKAEGILAGKIAGPELIVLLFLYVYGIGKAALMPMHRWLPAAMVAPTPVSALLHAVAVVKAGVFSIVKVVIYVFGLDMLRLSDGADWVLWIAGFTIISASIIALKQDNLKRRLAYSTISQLSYVTLAVFILAPLSIVAAALHIVAHAFGKVTLFFAAGSIYTASHKTNISQLNGIGYRMPWTMAAFTIGAISMIGLPPTAGFLSKWYMLQGAFQQEQVFAVLIIIASTLLNAAYFIPIIYTAWFKKEGQESGELVVHGEAPKAIVFALMTTASLTLLLFFFPDVPLQLAMLLIGEHPQ
ncbi:MAG: monovalent cation/H+ antiporter subunit D family protein [Cycloclasticus sp.]|jgi:multicomponent Na+:H+ antiporter subunit D|nr:monovalent cation/H+ antiporter subunit D family protein [Cycloclasticus sp.]